MQKYLHVPRSPPLLVAKITAYNEPIMDVHQIISLSRRGFSCRALSVTDLAISHQKNHPSRSTAWIMVVLFTTNSRPGWTLGYELELEDRNMFRKPLCYMDINDIRHVYIRYILFIERIESVTVGQTSKIKQVGIFIH